MRDTTTFWQRTDKLSTGMMRPGTVTAYWIITWPRTEFDAVRLPAADATWQMSTIGSHVPETLASITLQHAIRRLWNIRRFRRIIPVICQCASRRYTGETCGVSATTPPTFRDGIETCHLEKVQTLT